MWLGAYCRGMGSAGRQRWPRLGLAELPRWVAGIGCGGFSRQIPCCLSTALHSCLLASASMLHMLCRLLMLYCLLLQAGAGGPRQHRHGGFRSQRLQLQSSDGSLPPAGPTQSTGRAVLGQSQSTLEVPRLPSGEIVHRNASTV